jgi:Holliday junction DNA helicase RuvA
VIGWLQGHLRLAYPPDPTRKTSRTIILAVQGVGYEVIVPAKTCASFPAVGSPLELYVHLQVREDNLTLYGFPQMAERELFRQLLQVSGVGAHSAMALLDTLGLPDLVRAIVTNNHRLLTLAPGIGTKTAERLALELKTKLANQRFLDRASAPTLPPQMMEEIELTLIALGYSPQEIQQALAGVSLPPGQDVEVWLKALISWLAQ